MVNLTGDSQQEERFGNFGRHKYIVDTDLIRKAMLLYPEIQTQTISYGRAAEILGIRKSDLISLYDKMGYSYLDMIADDLQTDLENYKTAKGNSE